MFEILLALTIAAQATEPDTVAVPTPPAPFDHLYSDFTHFLRGAVSSQGLDYAALASRREHLDAHLQAIARADIHAFSQNEKVAFYVNAYNGYTLRVVLEEMPLASLRDIDGGELWTQRSFPVAGENLSLDRMEHEYARKLSDGRVHAVIHCASRGCPPLSPTPLRPVDLSAQLDSAVTVWASTNAFTIEGSSLRLNQIFDWYSEDFEVYVTVDLPKMTGKREAALSFLNLYVPHVVERVTTGELSVDFRPYDWSLNAL